MSERERLGPPPVDPLSDVAWARVERGLFSRLDSATLVTTAAPAPRRWVWLLAPAFAAVLILVVVIATRGITPPVTSSPETEARVVSSGAPASASFGDAHMTLDADSVVVMSHNASQALLERGAAWFTIGARGERPAFIVTAGDATVRVIGTRFRVSRDNESVNVHVEHGVVEVQFQGQHVKVAADQTWASERPTVVASDMVSPATAGVGKAPPTPAVATSTPSPAKKHHPTPVLPPHHVATPTIPPPTQVAPAVDPDKLEYDRLVALEKRNPDTAIAGYLKLSQGNGPWSAVALYAAGRAAFDHHDKRAEMLLTIYLQRFPSGHNADDVRILLTRLKSNP
jgi:FecR protein